MKVALKFPLFCLHLFLFLFLLVSPSIAKEITPELRDRLSHLVARLNEDQWSTRQNAQASIEREFIGSDYHDDLLLLLGASFHDTSDLEMKHRLKELISKAQKYGCGLTSETVERRIASCHHFQEAGNFRWTLVTRTSMGEKIWRDNTTLFLWASPTYIDQTYEDALSACYRHPPFQQRDLRWSLPAIDDYQDAEQHGIREIISSNHVDYWSSTSLAGDSRFAWAFSYKSGVVYQTHISFPLFVRCIARPQPLKSIPKD